MKLASITLPTYGNDNIALWSEHQELKHELIKEWGGYTVVDVRGAWKAPDGRIWPDSSMRYEVAMSRADLCKLREIARRFAGLCRQQCVMIVTPCGDVEFVEPENNIEVGLTPTNQPV